MTNLRTSAISALVAGVAVALFAVAFAAAMGSGDDSPLANQLIDTAAVRGLTVEHSAFQWQVSGDPAAMMGGGLCWIDIDDDGWLDLFVTDTWSEGEWARWQEVGSLPTTRLFRNERGNFTDVTEEWGAGFEVRGIGCTVADFEGDGDADLYVTSDRTNLLLVNSGEGFVDVAAEAGANLSGWQAGAAAGDLNGDGRVDLFLTGYADVNSPQSSDSGFPRSVVATRDVILLGADPLGETPMFERVEASQLGVEPDGPEYGLDVVLADADGDGDLDVYVANDTQPNRLYRNDFASGGDFADVSVAAGVDDSGSGMGIAVNDLNGDLVPDLAVTNLAGQGHTVFVSGGPASEALVWNTSNGAVGDLGLEDTGWGVAFVDLDSDGNLDSVVASGDIPIVEDTEPAPLGLFRGTTSGTFEQWPGEVLDALNLNGRAVAPADFDNDGDIDLAISSISGALVLLENQLEQGASLTVDAGHAPAGTIVRVVFEDGDVAERQITSGGNWLSAADPRVHIGFGETATPSTVEVVFPDGTALKRDAPESGILRVG